MKVYLIIILNLIVSIGLYSQTCNYTDLSDIFDYNVTLKRDKIQGEYTSSCKVTISIVKKSNKSENQTITYHSQFLFDKVFKDCGFVKSYIKKINLDKEISDNDYGDLIIADFNFDGLEDFAIKNDSGGNSGPTYDFYIQDLKGVFIKDTYLSSKVEFFPSVIDFNNKTLITLVSIGATEQSEMKYKYDNKTKSWTRTEHNIKEY
jgi:hypothetical protein